MSAFDFQTTHPHMQDAVSAPSLAAPTTAPSTGFNRYVKLGERPLGKGAYGEVFKVGTHPGPRPSSPPCIRCHHRLVRLHHSPPPLAQTLTPLSAPLCQLRDTVTGETCVLKRVSLCDSDATGGRLPLPVHSTWFADQRRRGNPGGETPATACGHTAAHVASPLTPHPINCGAKLRCSFSRLDVPNLRRLSPSPSPSENTTLTGRTGGEAPAALQYSCTPAAPEHRSH